MSFHVQAAGFLIFNLNFQPVIPFQVASRWNAIARTIVPINSVPPGPTTR